LCRLRQKHSMTSLQLVPSAQATERRDLRINRQLPGFSFPRREFL
jgi:hypothetical protein